MNNNDINQNQTFGNFGNSYMNDISDGFIYNRNSSFYSEIDELPPDKENKEKNIHHAVTERGNDSQIISPTLQMMKKGRTKKLIK